MAQPVVITGGRGFVGRHLAAELAAHWPDTRVVSWDLPEVDILKSDTYREQLLTLQPAWIIHLAAITSIPHALQNPEHVFHVNVEGTARLLKAIQELCPAVRLLAVSSADVYGGSQEPIAELPLSATHPRNPYAQSKKDMEEMIKRSFIKRSIIVRPFPHIGPGQGRGFVTADFASQIAKIEASGQHWQTISVGNLEAQRDFTDVRDVVRAYRLLMETGELGRVYNVASGRAVSIQYVFDYLVSLSTASVTARQDPSKMRPSDTPIIVGDAGYIKQATGWQPEIPLERSLRDVLNWWRSVISSP